MWKCLETLTKENGTKAEEYHVRIPPPFVEEFSGVPRPSRRWPDKTREIRDVNSDRVKIQSTPTCGDNLNPCNCFDCCKNCWEFLFQNLRLCFKGCSSAHENCSCKKSKFHPLDYKKGGFMEKRWNNFKYIYS